MSDTTSNGAGAAADPWSSASTDAANPWGTATSAADPSAGQSWLQHANPEAAHSFSFLHPFQDTLIPLQSWVETGIDWIVTHFRPVFSAVKLPVEALLGGVDTLLSSIPAPVMILIFVLLAWQLSGVRLAIGSFLSLLVLGGIGAWQEAMTTLSLVLTAVLFCALIGIPTGIWMARSERVNGVVRPLLDAMQTTPAFVYLVPIVMLFGIGNVPGVVVTIIFAVPPVIRLTNLGIRQVPADLVEAAHAFGVDERQLLTRVQLPLAMPTIMAGVNQTLMLCLSMVVIASMISVGGLGLMVLRGIGRLDIGLATVGGVGIVILAIILDRLTQALGRDARARGTRHWYQSGPVGFLYRHFKSSSD